MSLVWPFITDLFDLHSFVDCSIEGIGYGSRAVEFTDKMRALGMEHLKDEPSYLARRKHFQNLESFAKKEANDGHPYLFALVCVKLCSILEAAVDHMIVELLKDPRTIESSPRLLRLKGPLIEFMGATELDRMIYLREALKQDIASDLKIGAGRFESVLDALGLSGTIAPGVRKALLELHETRNIIVHNSSRVDRHLRARCPWITLDIGERVQVSGTQYRAYDSAALWYLIELDQRWGEKSDGWRLKEADEYLAELEGDVAAISPYGPSREQM